MLRSVFTQSQSCRVAACGDRTGHDCSHFRGRRKRRPYNRLSVWRLPFLSLATLSAACLTVDVTAPKIHGVEPEAHIGNLEPILRPYLEAYCIHCHGEEKQKGDRRWDTLRLPIEDTTSLLQVQEILDILNLGEMPPIEEDKQPSVSETKRIVEALTSTLESRYSLLKSTGQQTVFRRLNRREYRNTIRDLLNIDVSGFDPTQSFPRDQVEHHLDTIGDHLVTSGYLLDQYIEAADQIIEKVFAEKEKPPVQTWRFTDNFKQQPEMDGALRDWANYEFIALYETPLSQRHEGAYAKIHGFEQGVPHDGFYQIRANAIAKNRIHDHPEKRVSTNKNEPIQLGIVPGNQRYGDLSRPQPIEPQLALFELKDEILEWREATVWLDKGTTPRFTYPNGMVGLRGNFRPIADAFTAASNGELKNVDFSDRRLIAMQYGKLPHIQIHDVEITGPLYDSWPPPSQKSLLGDTPFSPDRLRELVTHFSTRAYRRPVEVAELDSLMTFVGRRINEGATPFEAYKDCLKRILCSPSFLYLHEPSESGQTLDAYALAARRSYFLWSSMPDEKLLSFATDETIQNPDTLKLELRRMLKDPKSQAFLNSFVDSILTLSDLGTQPPDRKLYPLYYARNLKDHMRTETLLFARHMLEENLPLSRFLDADFTFINGSLAELYGYETDAGTEFEKVSIPDQRRSGILGHASILTVTANGIDTSPVVRGVWMLENLLGTPPSPPPPDVEPFDPDTRGTTSIREQLEKHRENATCYDCHRKIDPMGFAFESFDAIGQWRDRYDSGVPVDASGTMPDGSTYENVEEFRGVLLTRMPQIARALTSKLLSYATGRRMEPADRPAIDAIVKELEERGNGFYDLVELVITSEPFRKP